MVTVVSSLLEGTVVLLVPGVVETVLYVVPLLSVGTVVSIVLYVVVIVELVYVVIFTQWPIRARRAVEIYQPE